MRMLNRVNCRPTPSSKYLNEAFAYDPEIGILMWKNRPRSHFKSDHTCNQVNSRCAGKVAGCVVNKNRVAVDASVRLDGVIYSSARIIWKLVTGKDASSYISIGDTAWPYFPFNKLKVHNERS